MEEAETLSMVLEHQNDDELTEIANDPGDPEGEISPTGLAAHPHDIGLDPQIGADPGGLARDGLGHQKDRQLDLCL